MTELLKNKFFQSNVLIFRKVHHILKLQADRAIHVNKRTFFFNSYIILNNCLNDIMEKVRDYRDNTG